MTDERLSQIKAAAGQWRYEPDATLLTMSLGKACEELIDELERMRAYGAAVIKGFCLDDDEPAAAPSAVPGVEER